MVVCSGVFSVFTKFIVGSSRGSLLTRNSIPIFQQNVGIKRSIEEKLGLPAKPRKPLPPYFRYLHQVRPTLVQKHPEAKVTEIAKIGAQLWQKVDETVRKQLEEEYRKDVAIYVTEVVKYENSLTAEQREEIKRAKIEEAENKERRKLKKKMKENDRPKRPANPFVAFLHEQMPTRGDIPFKEWQLKIVKEWEALPEEKKARYFEEHKKGMEVYKKNLQEWEEKMVRIGNIDLVRDEALIEPKHRAPSAKLSRRTSVQK